MHLIVKHKSHCSDDQQMMRFAGHVSCLSIFIRFITLITRNLLGSRLACIGFDKLRETRHDFCTTSYFIQRLPVA